MGQNFSMYGKVFWVVLLLAACGGNTYSVGGTVTGLNGTVVLQNNGSNNLSISANGAFTFAGYLTGGSAYKVTVLTQPTGQTCTVSSGSGTVNSTVTSVIVTCSNTSLARFAYVANSGNDSISQYTIGTDGALTAMATATVTAGTSPYSIAVDPSRKYAYVANSGSNNISQYTIGADGALKPMATRTVDAGTNPYSVTVDPSGMHAYAANSGSNDISQYSIGNDGALKPMAKATVAAGTNPYSVTIDRLGRHAYVANAGSNDISQYSIEEDGALTAVSTVRLPAGSAPYSIAIAVTPSVTPSGTYYAYVANSGSTTVSQFTIDSGSWKPMTPPTVDVGATPYSVTVDPDGKYAYVANSGNGGRVSQYTISTDIGSEGALIPMNTATVSAGATPRSVTVDSSGQYVYTANYDSGTISQYTIGTGNASTNGELTPIAAAVAAESKPIFVITVQ